MFKLIYDLDGREAKVGDTVKTDTDTEGEILSIHPRGGKDSGNLRIRPAGKNFTMIVSAPEIFAHWE